MRPNPDDDLDRVMDTGYGRRFLNDLIRQYTINDPFSSDALIMAHNLGMRQMASDLEARIRKVSAEKWMLLQREAMNLDEDEDKEQPEDA